MKKRKKKIKDGLTVDFYFFSSPFGVFKEKKILRKLRKRWRGAEGRRSEDG